MTREEVLSKISYCIKDAVPKEQYTLGDVKSCKDERPGTDVECYIVHGDTIFYGAFIGGDFYQYAVRSGAFTKPILLLYTPDWYVKLK